MPRISSSSGPVSTSTSPSGGPVISSGGSSGINLGEGITLFTAPSGSTPSAGAGQLINLGNLPAQNTTNFAIAAQNAANLALQQAQQLDPYVAQQFYANLERAIPGNEQLSAQASANALNMLRGAIPPDVADMIRMVSAEQQVSGAHAGTARNLGLTSLEIAQQGLANFQTLAQISPLLMPPTMDVFGATQNLTSALASRTTLDPAAALNAAVQMRGQDIRAQAEAASNQLRAQQLAQQAAQFNTQMEWARELSAMNRQYEQWQYNTELELYRQRLRQAQENQAALRGGAQQATSVFGSPVGPASGRFSGLFEQTRAQIAADSAGSGTSGAGNLASYTAPGSPAVVPSVRDFGLRSYGNNPNTPRYNQFGLVSSMNLNPTNLATSFGNAALSLSP